MSEPKGYPNKPLREPVRPFEDTVFALLRKTFLASRPNQATKGDGLLSDWQPIESAPKDGGEFVMLDVNVKTSAVGCWMVDVEWRNVGKKIGEALAEPGWFPLATPTHWMPLPPPPRASTDLLRGGCD